VATGGLAPPDGGPDEPKEGKDHRGDPKDMESKTGPNEDQHNEENEKEDHADTVPIDLESKRERQRDQKEQGVTARPSPR
jgi:hypothetical protein